jgi:hypothetical protein
VHGITSAPADGIVDGYRRQVWREGGEDLIESYTITGMAHGTPLGTAQSDGAVGVPGPFLLEAGISSSYHIAKFFGLTEVARTSEQQHAAAQNENAQASLVPDDREERVEIIPDDRVEILNGDAGAEPRFKQAKPEGAIDVMAIITKALTSAGLMKPPA